MKAENDDLLLSMLDELAVSDPSGATPPRTALPTSAHERFPIYERGDIPSAINVANSAISQAGLDVKVPDVWEGSAEASQRALASALSVIVVLAHSRAANVELRTESEQRLRQMVAERDSARKSAQRAEDKVATRETALRSAKLALDDARMRSTEAARKAAVEVAEGRTRLAAVLRREAALVVDLKKKEIELSKLQERMHTLLVNRGAVVNPMVQIVAPFGNGHGTTAAEGTTTVFADDGADDFATMVAGSYEERQEALVAEINGFRDILRAVYRELGGLVDELAIDSGETENDALLDDQVGSEYLGARTGLPLHMVRESIERELKHKLELLRRATHTATQG